jgi:hypothetical protein
VKIKVAEGTFSFHFAKAGQTSIWILAILATFWHNRKQHFAVPEHAVRLQLHNPQIMTRSINSLQSWVTTERALSYFGREPSNLLLDKQTFFRITNYIIIIIVNLPSDPGIGREKSTL